MGWAALHRASVRLDLGTYRPPLGRTIGESARSLRHLYLRRHRVGDAISFVRARAFLILTMLRSVRIFVDSAHFYHLSLVISCSINFLSCYGDSFHDSVLPVWCHHFISRPFSTPRYISALLDSAYTVIRAGVPHYRAFILPHSGHGGRTMLRKNRHSANRHGYLCIS